MAQRKRTKTRTSQKAALLETAKTVHVPSHVDVCVVGGGAAGIVAAIVAAEQGARVAVVERDLECGKTILATGNGRCNFANAQLDPLLYNDPSFVRDVCGSRWIEDILEFFETSGLAWVEESEGRLYPLSRQAASVRAVLIARARRAGVLFAPAREVVEMSKTNKAMQVTYREAWAEGRMASFRASSLVVASGGALSHGLDLGLLYREPHPLLCPIACKHPLLEPLDGRRVRSSVILSRDDKRIATQEGEVLFRAYGLSGIAIFNLSRFAIAGDIITMDLLPTLTLERACALGSIALEGILDPVIAQALQSMASDAKAAIALAKALPCTVTGLAETNHAQVRRGGFATTQFDPYTLRARGDDPVYVCGEVLDVDGPCGGFNLAWAWKSGMVAGAAAAKEALS